MADTFDVSSVLGPVDFGPTNSQTEILQNVRTILATTRYSVPLDREFGIPVQIDDPTPIARARLAADIIETVERYEPRVEVTEVLFDGDAAEGIIQPTVRVRLK